MEMIGFLIAFLLVATTTTIGGWLAGAPIEPEWWRFLAYAWGGASPFALLFGALVLSDR